MLKTTDYFDNFASMKIQYFSETDTLAIKLTTKPVAAADAITDDLILDYDSDGKVVAITLDNDFFLTTN